MLECAQCGWQGTFEQGIVDYFQELMDSSCPEVEKGSGVVYRHRKYFLAIEPTQTIKSSRAS